MQHRLAERLSRRGIASPREYARMGESGWCQKGSGGLSTSVGCEKTSKLSPFSLFFIAMTRSGTSSSGMAPGLADMRTVWTENCFMNFDGGMDVRASETLLQSLLPNAADDPPVRNLISA